MCVVIRRGAREQNNSLIWHDYNAAMLLSPKHKKITFNDFSFDNYIHMLYEKEQFIDLESHEVKGIKSWRFTAGGTDSRVGGTRTGSELGA